MVSITFNEAQAALGHLRNNQKGSKPPLLTVKGWEKSKKIYHLKDDIERAFSAEIDRFKDLVQERQKLQQEGAGLKEDQKDKRSKIRSSIQDINDEIQELFEQEQEFELTGGKLSEDEFGDVIDSGIFIDLKFAIAMNGEQESNEEE